MSAIRAELNLLLLALGFLTRLPISISLHYSESALNASSRYFGLIGAIIGLFMLAAYTSTSLLFPSSVAVLFLLIANLLLTGCFHQDGLADMADGFGGSFERSRKLEIMKDSRLGTYGSIALIAILGVHYALLIELDDLVVAVIVGQTVSRCLATSIIYNTPYAADPDASKAKPLSQAMSATDFLVLLTTATASLLLLPPMISLSLIASLLLLRFLFKRFIIAHIGGYTGDCLGAAQQLSEASIYLMLLAWQGATP